MKTGTVKWFNNAKGYGFILCDETSEDLFAHYSVIEMDGYRTLKAGQPVEFNVKPSDKGLHAIDIRVVTDDAESSQESSPTSDVA
ncbi:MAG TPA: cold shock domain protein CspD [Oceanospirillales bacterium]|nr:cold shock domain protein CspD [Oceanospirillaceae bacterium]HBS41446.1 cold shock domain protein CspD [Oceanospirillales bacterium]|tara:strand:- start:832 stop:1086 length:255 start_codon:yes stop_codon:yes gene_type:complete